MEKNILIAGVGGQGILSVAFVLDNAAMESNLNFKQTEVHGMAQRGGGVVSHVRISDKEIYSDMIPYGKADIILGVEPLETLRYTNYLKPNGVIIANEEPYINIPNYPPIEEVISNLKKYNSYIVAASELAKKAGNIYAQNMVLLGALSKFLSFIKKEVFEKWIKEAFKVKGEKIVDLNIKAFNYGLEAIKN